VRHFRYNLALLSSVCLHGFILLLLITSLEFSSTMPVLENTNNNIKIISAVAMNLPEPQPELSPPPPVKQPDTAPATPQTNTAEVLQKKQAIALQEQRKKARAKQQTLIEKQLLADLKKQTQKNTQRKQKNLEAAMAKELQEQAEKSLQQQIAQEQKRAAGAKTQGEVNKYKALILQAISRRWLVPSGIDKKRYAELLIRLAPGGTVLDVQVTKSSGNVSLDRSARDAVFKSSPLPVPREDNAFREFRQFVLKMKPENLIETTASLRALRSSGRGNPG
jgi:colicin import membrane protein